MKAIENGKVVNVTFPTESYHFGKVKINGEVVGTWVENREHLWHAKFQYENCECNVWSKYDKPSMVRLVKRLIEGGSLYENDFNRRY